MGLHDQSLPDGPGLNIQKGGSLSFFESNNQLLSGHSWSLLFFDKNLLKRRYQEKMDQLNRNILSFEKFDCEIPWYSAFNRFTLELHWDFEPQRTRLHRVPFTYFCIKSFRKRSTLEGVQGSLTRSYGASILCWICWRKRWVGTLFDWTLLVKNHLHGSTLCAGVLIKWVRKKHINIFSKPALLHRYRMPRAFYSSQFFGEISGRVWTLA